MSDRGFGHNKIDFVFIFVSRLINGNSQVRVPGYAACGYGPRPDWGGGRITVAGTASEGRRAIYALFVAGPCLTDRVYGQLACPVVLGSALSIRTTKARFGCRGRTVAQVVGKPQISALLMALMSTPRRAQHRQRFGAIETPVIERAAGDRAFELARARLG